MRITNRETLGVFVGRLYLIGYRDTPRGELGYRRASNARESGVYKWDECGGYTPVTGM